MKRKKLYLANKDLEDKIKKIRKGRKRRLCP
jgi:hypothetical protein